jgi:hypothetical protein
MINTMFRFKIQILDLDSMMIIWVEDDFKFKNFWITKLWISQKIKFSYKIYLHPSLKKYYYLKTNWPYRHLKRW